MHLAGGVAESNREGPARVIVWVPERKRFALT